MKKILLLSVWLVATIVVYAQEAGKGIQFLDNEPWEEVVKKAKKQTNFCRLLHKLVWPLQKISH